MSHPVRLASTRCVNARPDARSSVAAAALPIALALLLATAAIAAPPLAASAADASAADASAADASAADTSAVDTTAAGSFKELVLENGLTVLLGPAEPELNVAEALLVVQAGTGHEEGDQQGAAWVTGYAFGAGDWLDSGQPIRRHMAFHGVSLGLSVGRDLAVYHFTMPSGRSGNFVEIAGGLLGRQGLAEEAWQVAQRERREAVERELSDPWRQATWSFERAAWQQGAASEPPELPADGLTTGALQRFWQTRYTPSRMLLALWGDIDPEAIEAAIHQHVGPLPKGAGRSFLPPRRPRPETVGKMECIDGGSKPIMVSGQGIEVADEREFYGLQVLAQILGGSQSSRLHQRMRLEEQIVYTVEASCQPVGEQGLSLRVACQTDQVGQARRIVSQELARLAASGVSEEELASAVALLKSRLRLDQGSLEGAALRRARELLTQAPVRGPDGAAELLDGLTPAEVKALARRLLRPGELVTVVASSSPQSHCPRQGGAVGR